MAREWNITNGIFKNFTFHLANPGKGTNSGITMMDVNNERRLQISERALIDGADVEDFGKKARTFSAEVIFFGDDYQIQLKAFEKILDEGTTGILILPDVDQAINAKYQKHTRKTSATEGGCTILSVSWIEDRTSVVSETTATAAEQARAALASGNIAESAPTIQEQSSDALQKANSTLANLKSNSLLNSLQSAENSVTNTRVTLNTALNLPRNQRQGILSSIGQLTSGITDMKSGLAGLQTFASLLEFGLTVAAPTRINSSLGASDFASVDTPVTTTVIGGTTKVVQTNNAVTTISSFEQAVVMLKKTLKIVTDSSSALEVQTSGNTSVVSSSAISLVNSVKDLIKIIDIKSTKNVLTTSTTSLLEICFNNGLTVSDVNTVYKMNTFLSDILYVPAFTVINLP